MYTHILSIILSIPSTFQRKMDFILSHNVSIKKYEKNLDEIRNQYREKLQIQIDNGRLTSNLLNDH